MLIGGSEARDGVAAHAAGLDDPRRVFYALPGRSREEILEALAARLAQEGFVREPEELVRRLVEREKLGCTGLGGGIAIPHCKLRDLDDVVVAMASTENPIDFGAADGLPIRLIFLVASPAEAAAAHLQALARISRLLRTPGVADALKAAGSREALLEVLRGAENRAGVAP
jgi:PTS system nitrogen regulatory IIA component